VCPTATYRPALHPLEAPSAIAEAVSGPGEKAPEGVMRMMEAIRLNMYNSTDSRIYV
jgi:hypothetical protein